MRSQHLWLSIVLVAAACTPDRTPSDLPAGPNLARAELGTSEATAALVTLGDRVNSALALAGEGYRLDYAEWLGENDLGQQVFFLDYGNKQLGHDFVPGDPRRDGRTDISYTTDTAEGAVDGLTLAQTTAAIDRAMSTWNSVACSGPIPLTRVTFPPGIDLGVIEFLNGLGGSPDFFADITHAGWLPSGELPDNVIGATFTFVFVNPDGSLTDIDNNGKADVAFREILYNDAFVWRINGNIDVETVALHEAGHGLSQAHFGSAFQTLANGFIHFAPRAVMNAAYAGVLQALTGTDEAGHCSNWGGWSNN